MMKLNDAELQATTDEFKERLQGVEDDKKEAKILDEMLPEAFAVAREASRRTLGLEPYLVQIMGGISLHKGDISEMKTGEGKTLTAVLPVYLNALTGKGIHVITVNEYLSATQMEEMAVLYNFLGLTVGLKIGRAACRERV